MIPTKFLLRFENSRVAKLEEKLDSLAMLLGTGSNLSPSSESGSHLSTKDTPNGNTSSSSPANAVQSLLPNISKSHGHLSNLEERYEIPPSAPLLVTGHVLGTPLIQTPFEGMQEQEFSRANVLLDRFRSMSICFPFVVIPTTIDARTLSEERPFLFKTIMAAVEQNPHAQRCQVRDIMDYLALHMWQLGEKSLDLLLGVLVHISR